MERFMINHHYESKEHKNIIVLNRTDKMVYVLANNEVHGLKIRDANDSEYITMFLKDGCNSKKITWVANGIN